MRGFLIGGEGGIIRRFHAPHPAGSLRSFKFVPDEFVERVLIQSSPLTKKPRKRGLCMAEKAGLLGASCASPFGFAALIQIRSGRICRTVLIPSSPPNKKPRQAGLFYLAEKKGFEPLIRFSVYTLSRRAPSAARTLLQKLK